MARLTTSQLLPHTRELLEYSQSIVGRTIACQDTDDLGVMALLFAAKQVVHLETIHELITAKRHSDATVLARVMIEGMALLFWASDDPDDRAKKWRSYALVFDLRVLHERRQDGSPLSNEDRALLDRVRTEAAVFLKPGRQDYEDPDAYRSRWHVDSSGKPVSITQMVRSAGDPGLLKLYDSLSHWLHWNARGLGGGIRREGQNVRVAWDDDADGAWALAAAFQAALMTMRALDRHFSLGHSENLLGIRQRFVEANSFGSAV